MTAHYASPPRRPRSRIVTIGLCLVVLALAAAIAVSFLRARSKAEAEIAALKVVGPPCRQLSRDQALASGEDLSRTFHFQEVTILRASGHVACDEVAEEGGGHHGRFTECQFTTPGLLAVSAGPATTYFRPGPGQNATVTVRDDHPACVLGANLKS